MKIHKYLFFTLVCAFIFSPLGQSVAMEVPAQLAFKKISTPHFEIIYNAEQQELGDLYALQIEKAYTLLAPYFANRPEKTLVIINDKTDETNGYATRIPYPHIMTYPVLPGPNESLSDSGNWALELLGHEYTHILNFEPATGVFHSLRGVFGTVMAPNLLLPSWWKEGLAVQMESTISATGGRLKSYYQDATIRAMVQDHTWQNYHIDEVNEALPSWPEGMRPYLFGSVFWSQAVADHGKEVIDGLNVRHGGRVPYFMEAPAEDLLGGTYEMQYAKALDETEKRAEKQLHTLQQVTPTEIHPLVLNTKYSSGPAISDDGKYLALVTVDYKDDRVMKIFLRDPETGLMSKEVNVEIKKEEEPMTLRGSDGPPSGSIQKINWFHKSPKLVYDFLHYVNWTERYRDLYVYDLETRKTHPLSKALRAREPSVSPNDDKIVFVKLEGGRTHLGILDVASEQSSLLFDGKMQERISSPLFWDEDHIIYALRDHNGTEGLYNFDMKTKTSAPLLTEFKQARLPVKTKRGLMFVAVNNGVYNLYLADADLKTARPITHVTTQVSAAALDPDTERLYLTYMTSGGNQVVRIDKADWEKTPAALPVVDKLLGDRYPSAAPSQPVVLGPPTPTTTPEPTPMPPPFEVSDYHASDYLWPHFWIPFMWTSPEGGVVVQAQTQGFDPLQKHDYSAYVAWDTYQQRANAGFDYLNNVTPIPVGFGVSQINSYIVTAANRITDNLAYASISPEILGHSDRMATELGWRYLDRNVLGLDSKRTGPYASYVYRAFTQGGEQFTPQQGGGFYTSALEYIHAAGLDTNSQYQAGGVFYFSKFLPKLHSLVLRVSAFYIPEDISALYGVQSYSIDYTGDDLAAKFLARGYSTGQFLGKSMYNGSLEYRFPIKDIYHGSGLTPIFFRRIFGALVADGISTDGYAYDPVNQVYNYVRSSKVFWSYGAEAHLDTTLGYALPVTFVLGFYKGSDQEYAPTSTIGLALQMAPF